MEDFIKMRISTFKFDYLTEGLYQQHEFLFLKLSNNYSSLIEYSAKDEYIKDKEEKQLYDLFTNENDESIFHWKEEYTFVEKNKSNDIYYCLFAINHDSFIKICILLPNTNSPIIQYWIDKKEDTPSLEEAIDWVKNNINLSEQTDLSIKYYSFEPKSEFTILYPDTSEEWCSSAIGIVDRAFLEYDDGWYHAGELSKGNYLMNLEQVELLFSIFYNGTNSYKYLETYNHDGMNYYIYGKEFINDNNLPDSSIIYFNDSKELFIAKANTNLNKASDAIKSIYIDKVKKLRYALLNHWCEQLFEEKTINDNNAISVIYSNEERLHDVKILLINQDDNISVDVFVGYEKNYPMFIKSYYIDAIINRKIFRYSPLKIYEKDDKKYTLLNLETAEKQKILCLYNDKNPVIKEYSFNNYSIDKALSFVEKTL